MPSWWHPSSVRRAVCGFLSPAFAPLLLGFVPVHNPFMIPCPAQSLRVQRSPKVQTKSSSRHPISHNQPDQARQESLTTILPTNNQPKFQLNFSKDGIVVDTESVPVDIKVLLVKSSGNSSRRVLLRRRWRQR